MDDELEPYIDAWGVQSKTNNYHFIACRFKKHIVNCVFFNHSSPKIQPPVESIFLILERDLPLLKPNTKSLVFLARDVNQYNHYTPPCVTHSLLLRFFDRVYFKVFARNTLYVVSSNNPFSHCKPLKRDAYYRALEEFYAMNRSDNFDMDTYVQLKDFSLSSKTDQCFSSWFYMGHALVRKCYQKFFGLSLPCTNLDALYLSEILTRLERCRNQTPDIPSHFYTCQLTLDEEEPVGVQFTLNRWKQVEYVSPMIVSKTVQIFKDSNHVECDWWFPLFQNAERFRRNGIMCLYRDLKLNQYLVESLLDYAVLQSGEMYGYIYKDLSFVEYILFNQRRDPLG